MILGQFNLIHIPTFSHKIYFNITVFYNPRLRVTAVQEVSPQTVCHFVSFHSSWTDRKCHGLSFSVCPYEHTHTHTLLYPAERHSWPPTQCIISFSQRTVTKETFPVSCTSYLRTSYIASGWSKAFGEGSHQNVHIIWITAIIIQHASAILTYSSNAMGLI